MEKAHRAKLQKTFKASLKKARVICLDIPDDYEFMDSELVRCWRCAFPGIWGDPDEGRTVSAVAVVRRGA